MVKELLHQVQFANEILQTQVKLNSSPRLQLNLGRNGQFVDYCSWRENLEYPGSD